MDNRYYPFINLPLPYSYDALEPLIDEKTMRLHHDRHLQTYIDNLNAVLKDEPRLQTLSLEQLIRCAGRLPGRLRAPVRNNAGGVYNHRFFFEGLSPSSEPDSGAVLLKRIDQRFGSFEHFKSAFKTAALSVFGSGYAWLVDGECGLCILTTPNQQSPVEQCHRPVLAIDVWEHAYYLKHYNDRADYIDDWFKVVDWEQAQQNYLGRE